MSDWTLAGKPALLIVHMQNAIVKTPSPLEVLGHGRAAFHKAVVGSILPAIGLVTTTEDVIAHL